MTSEVWASWRAATIAGHADDQVRIGAWPAEGADARAAAVLAVLLPDGQLTADHQFMSIVNEDGLTVGALWFAPDRGDAHRAIFIWDIVIGEEFRGRGYGRAALTALEPVVRALGYDEISLHVFGDNDVARSLYRSAGYVETNVSMVKRLA
ncbi:MAG: GNAT family N-acetyltransferase [Candidatus Limnocylindrales bacterium]